MITVRNAQRKTRVELRELQNFAERALELCLREAARPNDSLGKLADIHVVLVSDQRIAALHKRFMNVSGPTDVITFDHGEIFISTETAGRQAREFNSSIGDEIRLYIVHGLLHLRGFDDTTSRARSKMETVQARISAAAAKT